MSYYEQIDEYTERYNTALELYCDYRKKYTDYDVILRTLASQNSPLKNTASIDNKINSLLSLEDEQIRDTAIKLYEQVRKYEVAYKCERDKIKGLHLLIIELQSRRKAENTIK